MEICKCDFEVLSRPVNAVSSEYSRRERYPKTYCEQAVSFLKQLEHNNLSNPGATEIAVTYTVRQIGKKPYTASVPETPLEAANKIELYMRGTKLMPTGKS